MMSVMRRLRWVIAFASSIWLSKRLVTHVRGGRGGGCPARTMRRERGRVGKARAVRARIGGPLPRRYRWAAVGLEVQKRFSELHGGMLARGVTLAAFLSLFPLLLLVI